MADKSKIEWTEATWNPVTGCTKVSPGCDHCYAETFAERFRGTKGHPYEHGFDLTLRPERLDQPLRWKRPRRVFVNSMSDLFHEQVPEEFIVRVFAVMAASPWHTFQVLTKRHGRMRSLLNGDLFEAAVMDRVDFLCADHPPYAQPEWPLPNVWLGVSVEDQKWADIRIPALLQTPAAVRWLSCEPLLGPVDLHAHDDGLHHWLPDFGPYYDDGSGEPVCQAHGLSQCVQGCAFIDWVVVGGESGPGARPMHPGWARSLRDQCTAAGVPYFFKQWGGWAPNGYRGIGNFNGRERLVGPALDDMGHREVIERVGKRAAGRELDGRTWDEYPARSA